MLRAVIYYIKRTLLRRRWRKKNRHNLTHIIGVFPIEQVEVGKGTYGGIDVMVYNLKSRLRIGNYCSIGPQVKFILSAEHYTNTITTYPLKVKLLGQEYEAESRGDIVLEDDVWIGYGATIMSGITIGQGAVVAAGAIVTKDVPPYAIVGGIPARVIRYRFSEKIISRLMNLDFSKIEASYVKEHMEAFYSDITKQENADRVLEELIEMQNNAPEGTLG